MLDERDAAIFERFRKLEATENDRRIIPALLCKWLHEATGEPVVVLIDEYDTPIQSAWDGGYYDEMIDFLRAFLSSACKDNPHVFRAVITGILRVANRPIIKLVPASDLNVWAKEQLCTTFLHSIFFAGLSLLVPSSLHFGHVRMRRTVSSVCPLYIAAVNSARYRRIDSA